MGSTLTLTDPATGLRHSAVRWPDGTPPPLFGCRWCGRPEVEHAMVAIVEGPDWHVYCLPTLAQRRHRALAAASAEIRRMVATARGDVPAGWHGDAC